jgi:hypothetical protein
MQEGQFSLKIFTWIYGGAKDGEGIGLVFFTASDITTVAEARADAVGTMVRDFGCKAIMENNGGTKGVGVDPGQEVGGGFAFVVEFKMARIDEAAFFGVSLKKVTAARGAVNCPRAREGD